MTTHQLAVCLNMFVSIHYKLTVNINNLTKNTHKGNM